LRIIRAAEHRRMPWKNGGGETTEILVSPEGAGLDAFDWRVSIARIGTDGPFSVFAQIDRTLCLIDGEGLALTVAGKPEVVLGPESPPLAFPGDVAVAARLVDGPVTDLNVMTRRGRWRHELARSAIAAPRALIWGADITLLLSRSQGLVVAGEAGRATLGRDDAIIFERPVGIMLEPRGAASVVVVELWSEPSRGSVPSASSS
jgi:environmental stress-induced protein Ves